MPSGSGTGQKSGSASRTHTPMQGMLGGAPGGESQTAQQPADTKTGNPNRFSSPKGYPACRFFDGFKDNGDGTVTDPRDGLIWKRCAEGQEWTGQTCTGSGSVITYYDATRLAKSSRFGGKVDWRMPTIEELSNVVGSYDACKWLVTKGNRSGVASSDIPFPMNPDPRSDSSHIGNFWSISRFPDREIKRLCDNPTSNQQGLSLAECAKQELRELRMAQSFISGAAYPVRVINKPGMFLRLVRGGAKDGQASFNSELDKIKSEEKITVARRLEAVKKNKEEDAQREEARRARLNRSASDGRSRGGVDTLRILDITKAYWVLCNNRYTDTFSRLDVSGEYCGRASNDSWKCFQQPSLTAQHICQ